MVRPDGLSGAAFHLTLLDAFEALGARGPAEITSANKVIQIPQLQLPPSMEDARHWPLSTFFIIGEVVKEFVFNNKDAQRWTGPPITFSPESPPQTRLLMHFMSPSNSAKMAQMCRENKTTITALLTVIIADGMAIAYPTHSRFPASLATSMRHFTGTDKRQMANQYSGMTVHCSSKGECGYINCYYIDWDVVRACKVVIDGAVKSPANQITIILKFLSDNGGFLRKKIGQPKSHSFELSNVGVVDGGLDRDGVARFGQFVFSQSANVTEPAYNFSVATVKGGAMTISLTWQKGIIEEDKAKQVLNHLTTRLHLLGMEGDLQNAKSE